MAATSNIFQTLLDEKINHFIYSFKEASRELFYDKEIERLRHAGEFGRLREMTSKDFIRFITPSRLDIGTGFVINHAGDVSSQVDLVIYDRNETPLIQDSERQYFYPAETVCAIGEVKSILTKDQFKVAINKLARIKKIRERITETDTAIVKSNPERPLPTKFDPVRFDNDRFLSFLICEKLDFDFLKLTDQVNSLYESDIEQRNKHNLILSIQDGLLLYNASPYLHGELGITFSPVSVIFKPDQIALKNLFVVPSEEKPFLHFKLFSSLFNSRTKSISILSPDLTIYMGKIETNISYALEE